MTRRVILLKWILYCLCALALALLQGLVLVYVRVWGVHPFLLPAIAVIPATLERNEQALLYAVFFGLACDLLSPVAGLPCFYALAFLIGAAIAWLLSGQVIMAGVVCSLVATGVCMLLCGLLHMAVLAGHSGAGLTAAGLLLGEYARLGAAAQADHTARRTALAVQHLQKRGLACAVGTCNDELVPAVNDVVQGVDEGAFTDMDAQILHDDQLVIGLNVVLKAKVQLPRLGSRGLDDLELFQLLAAALGHLGGGGADEVAVDVVL